VTSAKPHTRRSFDVRSQKILITARLALRHFSDLSGPAADVRLWGVKPTSQLRVSTSEFDPSVWTGRALQAGCEQMEGVVLRICIRPLHGAFVLLAIMDIRAHPISFSERP
jgi:hypothetical protein